MSLLSFASAAPAQAATPPLLLVHYMPWFEANPAAHQWGWHWTMNHFDPDKITTGQRDIAAHYYPIIGPYDSNDPAVLEYHLLLMKLSGIDGVVIDWYGLSNLYDYPIIQRNTLALIKAANKIGLKYAICYEDQTITHLIETKKLSASDRVKHAVAELDWLGQNWFRDANYIKLDGKPLLLSFGWDHLSDAEWTQVLSATTSKPVYLSEHRKRTSAAGAFDWPVPQNGLSSLDTFYSSAKGWRVTMPAVYPRFHDIYKEAGVNNGYGQIPDDKGRTFAISLERALASGAPLVQIVTWNDWGEGTIIEPSVEFGTRDLEAVQKARKATTTAADLQLPLRLFRLRQVAVHQTNLTPALDQIAHGLASGAISQARTALSAAEAAAKK